MELRVQQHKTVRAGLAIGHEEERERSGGDACDIDGKTDRSKWAGAHESKRGQRMSFKMGAVVLNKPQINGETKLSSATRRPRRMELRDQRHRR
jgi:hypothetical protein